MHPLRILLYLILPLIALSLSACFYIAFSGLHDNLHSADVAVVLGNTVLPNGKPSKVLQSRLDHTVELYQQGYFKHVLVSGAHGKEGYDEAFAMRRYLEANGVPHDAIFEDNDGFTTWWTARNTAQFLKAHNLTSVLIISQYYHMPRCRLVFAKFGIHPVYTSHAPYWRIGDFYSLFRETIAYPVYALRDINDANPPEASW